MRVIFHVNSSVNFYIQQISVQTVLWFLCLSFVPAQSAIKFEKNSQGFRINGNLTEEYWKTEVLNSLPATGLSVVYGNQQYGFFEKTAIEFDKQSVRVSFIPPGYIYPIRFYVRDPGKKKLRFLKERRFQAPDLAPFKPFKLGKTSAVGAGGSPFFLMGITTRIPKYGVLGPLPVIINRFGEIVWMYSGYQQYFLKSDPAYQVVGQVLGPGDYGFVLRAKESKFIRVNERGQLIDSFVFSKYPSVHHDYVFNKNTRQLLTLGNECIKTRNDLTWFYSKNGVRGWIFGLFTSLFWPRTYLGTTINQTDLNTGIEKIIWRSSENLQISKDFEMNSRAALYETLDFLKYRNLHKNPEIRIESIPPCHTDWSHGNSIVPYGDNGFLLSYKNLNQIDLWSPDFKKRKWSLGSQNRNSIKMENSHDSFSGQHTPSITSRGNLLLFDNHLRGGLNKYGEGIGSRIMEIAIDSERGIGKLVWESKPLEPLLIPGKGSAEELPNGNFLGYFPARDFSSVAHIVEFSKETGAPVYDLSLGGNLISDGGMRVRAISAVSDEKYLGLDIN